MSSFTDLPAMPDLSGEAAVAWDRAVEAVVSEARQAARLAEYRILARKAQAAIRKFGGSYAAAAVNSLREAFPEYTADVTMGSVDSTAHRQLPLNAAADDTVVPVVPVVEDDDEDAEECDHEDHPWVCTRCGGRYDGDGCDDHTMECDQCGHEHACPSCGLEADDNCRHVWRCTGCEAEDV